MTGSRFTRPQRAGVPMTTPTTTEAHGRLWRRGCGEVVRELMIEHVIRMRGTLQANACVSYVLDLTGSRGAGSVTPGAP